MMKDKGLGKKKTGGVIQDCDRNRRCASALSAFLLRCLEAVLVALPSYAVLMATMTWLIPVVTAFLGGCAGITYESPWMDVVLMMFLPGGFFALFLCFAELYLVNKWYKCVDAKVSVWVAAVKKKVK